MVLEIELRKAQRMDGIQLTFAIFTELLRLCTGELREQRARPLSPMLREEVRKLDQYIEDYKLLCAENIGTAEELSLFSGSLQEQIMELERQRNTIRNHIRRAAPEDAAKLKKQAMEITKQITPLRKQQKSARRIEERSQVIPILLEQERQMENETHRRNHTDIQLKTLSRRIEVFNMKIIMRRESVIFYSENHRFDNAVRRCLSN